MDNTSLNDSLFLEKRSIKDYFKDLLREKRGFEYNLVAEITLKRWNNAINRYDIETIFIRSNAVRVINQIFNLEASNEILKNILDIWTGFGSGWIIDKIENIFIELANYDPSAGSNLKNNIKSFKWCHVRLLNPQNKDPDKIKKQYKK